MKLVLDTSGYSKLFRNYNALIDLIEHADHVYFPAVMVGELYAGFQQGSRFDANVKELDAILRLSGVTIVNIDRDIAERYGMLVRILKEKGTPIPTNDIWIASTALELGARLVTYDADFHQIPGLIVLAP